MPIRLCAKHDSMIASFADFVTTECSLSFSFIKDMANLGEKAMRTKTYFLLLMLFGLLTGDSSATCIEVMNSSDNDPNSLRDAISNATTGDTIKFARSTNGNRILLHGPIAFTSKNLTFLGNGASNTIIDNYTFPSGNRLLDIHSSEVKIIGMTFRNGGGDTTKVTDLWGGAIRYISSGMTLSIEDCEFINNSARLGGAIRIQDGNLLLDRCLFSDNRALGLGGAINSRVNSHQATNCLFYSNGSTSSGGAIENESGGIWDIANCTFVYNKAETMGGAIHNSGTINIFHNNIIYDNEAPNGPEIFTMTSPVTSATNVLKDFTNSGLAAGVDGNFSASPNFVNPGYGNFHLRNPSPCEDAGTAHLLGDSLDLDGYVRDFNGIDIGAYEGLCPTLQEVIHVDNFTTRPHANGNTWSQAFNYVQDAVDRACDCYQDGKSPEIWVAEGNYAPSKDNPKSNDNTYRDQSIYIDRNVQIYGGFGVGDTKISDRNLLAHPTALVGLLANNLDAAFHTLFIDASLNPIDSNCIIDGFKIIGGKADGGGIDANGAGAYLNADGGNCSPLFRRCNFMFNASDGEGGAVHIRSEKDNHYSYPRFEFCEFRQNTALRGGAIYLAASDEGFLDAKFINCVFYKNEAMNGGGIFHFSSNQGSSGIQLNNCVLNQDTAHELGGAIFNDHTDFTGYLYLYNTILWNNAAQNDHEIHSTGSYYNYFRNVIFDFSGADLNTIDTGDVYNTDPLFKNESVGILDLMSTSPAIDKGNNQWVGNTVDLEGEARIKNATVDIGAYEHGDPCESAMSFLRPNHFLGEQVYDFTTDDAIQADNIIGANSNVIFDADMGVALNGGFEVEPLGLFEIKVTGCP